METDMRANGERGSQAEERACELITRHAAVQAPLRSSLAQQQRTSNNDFKTWNSFLPTKLTLCRFVCIPSAFHFLLSIGENYISIRTFHRQRDQRRAMNNYRTYITQIISSTIPFLFAKNENIFFKEIKNRCITPRSLSQPIRSMLFYERYKVSSSARSRLCMHLSHEKRATRIVMEVILILDCGARRNFIPISQIQLI